MCEKNEIRAPNYTKDELLALVNAYVKNKDVIEGKVCQMNIFNLMRKN
jgi:hypothetical protein